MKQFLLSILLVGLTGFLFGQSLELIHDGNTIESGSTLYILGDPTDEVIQVKLDVKNTSASSINVKVKKVIQPGDTIPLTSNYFCWGACYPPFVYESGEVAIEGGATNSELPEIMSLKDIPENQ